MSNIAAEITFSSSNLLVILIEGVDCSQMQKLKLRPISAYQRTTNYAKPVEIGCFSFTEHRKLEPNSRKSLHKYVDPPIGSDLNTGFPQNYTVRAQINEHLDALLTTLEGISLKSTPDFITWRGMMTRIACTPYTNDDWEMNVCLKNGTIFIEDYISPTQSRQSYPDEQRMTYYGYKFESICTNTPHSDHNSLVVDTNVQFCSVFTAKLGDSTIIMGGEVDCLYENEYAELKTNRVLLNKKNKTSFIRFKLLKTWLQSYLIGVKTVIIGFRNDAGILVQTQKYRTEELPRMARECNLWDPNVALSFAGDVLQFVKNQVEFELCVYSLRFDSKSGDVILQLPSDTREIFV